MALASLDRGELLGLVAIRLWQVHNCALDHAFDCATRRIAGGEIVFDGKNLLQLSTRDAPMRGDDTR